VDDETKLLDALRRDPTAPAPFRRYGEWLREKRDPRADFVLLSSDLAERPTDKALARKVTARRKKLEASLLGKAYLERLAKNWWGGVELEWAYGFVKRARFFSFDPEVYALFAAAPAARGPIDLVVEGTLDDPTPALAKHPLPWVRELTLGTADSRWGDLSLAQIGAALPRETLRASADRFDVGTLASSTITRIHLDEPMMSASTIDALANADLHRLEALVLDLGWFDVNDKASEHVRNSWKPLLDAIERLARADGLPALRRLALRGSGRPTGVIARIAKTPLGKRLEALDVSQPVDGDPFERDARDIDLLFAFDEIEKEMAATSMKIHLVGTFARRQSASDLTKKYAGRIETRHGIE
jgi:hypothetical protein